MNSTSTSCNFCLFKTSPGSLTRSCRQSSFCLVLLLNLALHRGKESQDPAMPMMPMVVSHEHPVINAAHVDRDLVYCNPTFSNICSLYFLCCCVLFCIVLCHFLRFWIKPTTLALFVCGCSAIALVGWLPRVLRCVLPGDFPGLLHFAGAPFPLVRGRVTVSA